MEDGVISESEFEDFCKFRNLRNFRNFEILRL